MLEGTDMQKAQAIAKEISPSIDKLAKEKVDPKADVGCSICLCQLSEQSATAKEVLDKADQACYYAKKSDAHVVSVPNLTVAR